MNKRKTGSEFEQVAANELTRQGYRILEKNFRCPQGEIDLIAKKDGYFVFVEVKYRSSDRSGRPEDAVDIRKQKRISRTALWYLTKKGLGVYAPCRFDVVAMDRDGIRIYEHAFEYIG